MTIHPNLADLERAYRGPAVRPGVSSGLIRVLIIGLLVEAVVGAALLWVLS